LQAAAHLLKGFEPGQKLRKLLVTELQTVLCLYEGVRIEHALDLERGHVRGLVAARWGRRRLLTQRDPAGGRYRQRGRHANQPSLQVHDGPERPISPLSS